LTGLNGEDKLQIGLTTLSKVSVALNGCLAFCLAVLLVTQTTKPQPRSELPAQTPSNFGSQIIAHEAAPKAFNWSQLESSDYRDYIANLRGVGCPEQTIRDIITADVDNLYERRRGQLRQQSLASLNDSSEGVANQMAHLRDEEAGVLVALLGQQLSRVSDASDAAVPARLPRKKANQRPALPLVFETFDPSSLGLNAQQIEAVEELRQRFVEEIGGPNQNANDPVYRERWLKAQPEVDDTLRGLIGVSAFQNLQLEAAP
jgi:hypothetical protein